MRRLRRRCGTAACASAAAPWRGCWSSRRARTCSASTAPGPPGVAQCRVVYRHCATLFGSATVAPRLLAKLVISMPGVRKKSSVDSCRHCRLLSQEAPCMHGCVKPPAQDKLEELCHDNASDSTQAQTSAVTQDGVSAGGLRRAVPDAGGGQQGAPQGAHQPVAAVGGALGAHRVAAVLHPERCAPQLPLDRSVMEQRGTGGQATDVTQHCMLNLQTTSWRQLACFQLRRGDKRALMDYSAAEAMTCIMCVRGPCLVLLEQRHSTLVVNPRRAATFVLVRRCGGHQWRRVERLLGDDQVQQGRVPAVAAAADWRRTATAAIGGRRAW